MGDFFVTFEIFFMQQWFLAMCAVILVIVIETYIVKVTWTPEINEKYISSVNIYLASTDALGY